MTERPILFSAPMVRAILSGAKTMTRRVVEPQPSADARSGHFLPSGAAGDGTTWPAGALFSQGPSCDPPWAQEPGHLVKCRYGQPGDRLWVRESLGYDCEWGHYFAADRKFLCELFDDEEAGTGPSYDDCMPDRSIPSIHLPRRYSRILLELTSVRVERLQDISEADALAEGCVSKWAEQAPALDEARQEFRDLWESINGTGSWDADPWVWVVEFRRLP